MYVTSKKAQEFHKVSGETLRQWVIKGEIEFITTKKDIGDIKLFQLETKQNNKKINVKKTKWNIKKRISLLRTKIKNKVCDLHWQSCSFLVKNFQNIIVPKFGSKNMCRKKKRNIVKSTVKKNVEPRPL